MDRDRRRFFMLRPAGPGRFAAFATQLRFAHALPLFALGAMAFVVLAAVPQASSVASICGRLDFGVLAEPGQLRLLLPSPLRLAVEWGLMAVAMMAPLVAPQFAYVRRSSPPSRRWSAPAAMVAAYLLVWLLAGVLLLPLAFALSIVLPGQAVALVAALGLASLWSASPLAQAARNRCHVALRISPFGLRGYLDAARQGAATGAACVAGCWPWMLVPLMVEGVHVAAMLAVAIYLFAERIAPAARPVWRLPPAWETLLGPLGLSPASRPAAASIAVSARLSSRKGSSVESP